VDELNLTPNIVPAHPPNLSLSDHVDGFITLKVMPWGLAFSPTANRVVDTVVSGQPQLRNTCPN
jgi:hypothetical protein